MLLCKTLAMFETVKDKGGVPVTKSEIISSYYKFEEISSLSHTADYMMTLKFKG